MPAVSLEGIGYSGCDDVGCAPLAGKRACCPTVPGKGFLLKKVFFASQTHTHTKTHGAVGNGEHSLQVHHTLVD